MKAWSWQRSSAPASSRAPSSCPSRWCRCSTAGDGAHREHARGPGLRRAVRKPASLPEHHPLLFGDRLEYRHEDELLGTAGGVRHVADFFGDDRVVVVSADALTDLDVNALVERHRQGDGIGALTVKKVRDPGE